MDGKLWLPVNDAGIAVVRIRMNHSGFTRYNVADAAAIIAVEILPRRIDLEQSVVIIGDGIAIRSGHKLVDVHRRRRDQSVMNLDLGYFIGLDYYGCLTIDSFRIDEVVNLGAPVDARKWLRSQLTEGYRGALRKNLTRFPLEAVGGVAGNDITDCDSSISVRLLASWQFDVLAGDLEFSTFRQVGFGGWDSCT